MKCLRKLICILISSAVANSSLGYVTTEFPGWDELTRFTPFVIIVQCTHAPVSPRLINGVMSDNPLLVGTSGDLTLSDVKMVATLKPETDGPEAGSSPQDEMAAILKAGNSLTLWSEYRPRQGDDYLLFVTQFRSTNCNAFDFYRVVPLGHSFNTNWLTGKNLNDQIKFMLQYRLDNLKRELQTGEEEKGRLEAGLNTTTNPAPAVPKATP